jgi:hypothetical protein
MCGKREKRKVQRVEKEITKRARLKEHTRWTKRDRRRKRERRVREREREREGRQL